MAFLHADQLLAHLVGDYVLQSDWMATEKTKSHFATSVHAAVYTVPFLLLTTDSIALGFVCLTHFIIDRWRLARYVVWLRNRIGPWRHVCGERQASGSPGAVPPWMAAWVLIVVDNTLHLIINASLL